MSDWVDFGAIKHSMGIEAVLERYGIRLKRVRAQYLRGPCPLPTHCSEQSRESFGVHTGKNVWACHSASCCQARQGKVGGTILDLVAWMEGCTIREAALRLQMRWSGAADGAMPNQLVSKGRSAVGSNPEPSRLPFCLPLCTWHPYLEQRGMERHTAAHFGVGYYGGRGLLRGTMVIKKHLRLVEPPREQIAGYANVVALMGTNLSDKQWELLQRDFPETIVMLDGDEAGQRASRVLSTRGAAVCLARVPMGRQPDQLSAEEIQRIITTVPRCVPAA